MEVPPCFLMRSGYFETYDHDHRPGMVTVQEVRRGTVIGMAIVLEMLTSIETVTFLGMVTILVMGGADDWIPCIVMNIIWAERQTNATI